MTYDDPTCTECGEPAFGSALCDDCETAAEATLALIWGASK